MGRFREMLGQGEFKIGTETFKISPTISECEKFNVIRKKLEKDQDLEVLKANNELVFDMLVRSDKSYTDEDKDELKNFIYLNQKECLEECQILFKWTTREEREEHKAIIKKSLSNGDILKNLIGDKK